MCTAVENLWHNLYYKYAQSDGINSGTLWNEEEWQGEGRRKVLSEFFFLWGKMEMVEEEKMEIFVFFAAVTGIVWFVDGNEEEKIDSLEVENKLAN